MHDKDKKQLNIGDKVRKKSGAEFYINGALLDDGTLEGGNIGGAKQVALASEVELVKAHDQERKVLGGGSIVWGNGPPPPPPPV